MTPAGLNLAIPSSIGRCLNHGAPKIAATTPPHPPTKKQAKAGGSGDRTHAGQPHRLSTSVALSARPRPHPAPEAGAEPEPIGRAGGRQDACRLHASAQCRATLLWCGQAAPRRCTHLRSMLHFNQAGHLWSSGLTSAPSTQAIEQQL